MIVLSSKLEQVMLLVSFVEAHGNLRVVDGHLADVGIIIVW